jgi:hypothetical protein
VGGGALEPRDLAADGGFMAGARLSRADQLAFMRTARGHRNSSMSGGSRPITRRPG